MSDKIFFRNYALAGYPLLWIETYEEYRAMTCFVKEMQASQDEYSFFSWDRIDGIKKRSMAEGILTSQLVVPKLKDGEENHLDDPMIGLDWAETAMKDNSVLFLLDYHHYIKKDAVSRKIRNLLPFFKAKGKVLAVVSHMMDAPAELEKEIAVVRFNLPDKNDLKLILKGLCESAYRTSTKTPKVNPYPKDEKIENSVIESALGLTSIEAENAFSISLIEKNGMDPDIVRREKAATVKKTGFLEVIENSNTTLADIGGLDNLKDWLVDREDCFSPKARQFGIAPPKGLLLTGVPGSGKSLSAKAVSNIWHRPLLRFDMSKILGAYVGDSESNLRKCLHIASAVAPCVVWIDELEKAFAGAKGDSSGDSGTTKRVFGAFLTWMSEKTEDVFIVATANEVASLPPALLRGGRFDAIFWVDVPDAKQREEIISIHLKKVGRPVAMFDLKALVGASDTFTGAEIEVWVKEALVTAYKAKDKNGAPLSDLQTKHLLQTSKEITPIARLMAEELEASRAWAKDHGVKYATKSTEVLIEVPAVKPGVRKFGSNGMN
jgi:ATP-dependent 26S proteasome regulatory subunit